MIQSFLNHKGHQNPIRGLKVTAILLKGLILPIGGTSAVEGLWSTELTRLVCVMCCVYTFNFGTVWFITIKKIPTVNSLKVFERGCHFVTFEKSKTTCSFNGNEAWRQSYLTGLLTMLPGEHISLLWSSCPLSKPIEEAFVIVLARLNPSTADPIRHCVSSPLGMKFCSIWLKSVPLKWEKLGH